MNILHIYKDYYPVLGGIENHIKVVAEAQAKLGHQVIVLVCSLRPQTTIETVNGVKLMRSGRITTLASMPLSLSQPVILARLRPDIAHVHTPYPLGEFANWLLGRAKATVITYHSDVVRQRNLLRFYGPIFRRVLQKTDRIIATSPRYIDSSPWLKVVRDKCRVVPLAVDTARFTPSVRPKRDWFNLLFVGRLRYYKGLDTLLQALSQLPKVHLTIVGTGPMQQAWQTQATDLNLNDRVTFAGEVEDADLPGYYHRADAFVLPANARSEAFGMVLIEAMAAGLPCITTEVGTGTSWVVQDGITGLVIPPSDPTALTKAIDTLAQDETLRQQLGQAGLQRVQTIFTPEGMVEGIMEVYAEITEKS